MGRYSCSCLCSMLYLSQSSVSESSPSSSLYGERFCICSELNSYGNSGRTKQSPRRIIGKRSLSLVGHYRIVFAESDFERVDELAAEDAAEHFDGQEERLAG